MSNENIIGMKYQTFIDDESVIYRAKKRASDNSYLLENINNPKDKITETVEKLKSAYVAIMPDAFLNIMCTEEPSEENDPTVCDVYFCIARASDTAMGVTTPALFMRQNYFNETANIGCNITNKIVIGDCKTIVDSSKEDIEAMFTATAFTDIDSICLYMDDSTEDILSLITGHIKDSIDNTLNDIADFFNKIDTITGYYRSVEDLFEALEFTARYKSIFNIIQIDFPIVDNRRSYDKNGNIIISDKKRARLEMLIRRYIDNLIVIKYDKDIDVSRIVTKNHMVVCDSDKQIYLIAYDVLGYMDANNDNADIVNSMRR